MPSQANLRSKVMRKQEFINAGEANELKNKGKQPIWHVTNRARHPTFKGILQVKVSKPIPRFNATITINQRCV